MTGENRRMRDTGEPIPLDEAEFRTSTRLSSRALLKAQILSGQCWLTLEQKLERLREMRG